MTNPGAYVPIHALRKIDLHSILSVAVPLLNNDETKRKFDYHHSRRTMLYFLLSMKPTLDNGNHEQLMNAIKEYKRTLEWADVENEYHRLKRVVEPYQNQYRAESSGAYWELKKCIRFGPKQSTEYISIHRKNGFQLHELKIYWNYDQIRNLNKDNQFNPTTDTDTNTALNKSPVNTRDNPGEIKFLQSGIEDAVFKVPENNQVIVLDFADERMPGGYFLENAQTQEEVILYNSDGYQALLDLKYKVMDGGYMLPEFGVAYVKNVRFFQKQPNQERVTDLILTACYDLSGMGEGLYKPPSREKLDELRERTYQKFQAMVASAVANTEGNGENTYLLLGPIGTGAFANDMKMIAELFSKVLNEPLMDSTKPIRHAFKEIWFVSTDKLDTFAKEFPNKVK